MMALWRPLPAWHVSRGREVATEPRLVGVIPGQPVGQVEYMIPNQSPDWLGVAPKDGCAPVPVSERVTLLRLTTTGPRTSYRAHGR